MERFQKYFFRFRFCDANKNERPNPKAIEMGFFSKSNDAEYFYVPI